MSKEICCNIGIHQMSHVAIVARYKEDVRWIRDTIPQEYRVILYNKGDDLSNGEIHPNGTVRNVTNEGRETETYLRFIIENYDNLPDVMVFLQGEPFPHMEADLTTALSKLLDLDMEGNLFPLSMRWLRSKQIPPDNVVDAYRSSAPYAINMLHFDRLNCFNLNSERYHDQGTPAIVESYQRYHRIKNGTNILHHSATLVGLADDYIPSSSNSLKFFFAAQFAVRKAAILAHDKSVYERMAEEACRHSSWGFICERLWFVLFDRKNALATGDIVHIGLKNGKNVIHETSKLGPRYISYNM